MTAAGLQARARSRPDSYGQTTMICYSERDWQICEQRVEMNISEGGCLCESLRYQVQDAPTRITTCHCTFCQRSTGSAYMVQPVYEADRFKMIRGTPKTYTHRSTGSGLEVYIHFCDACGTKLYLTFERFPGFVGLYAGTLDNPNFFEQTPQNAKHVFLCVAQKGTIIPAHLDTFTEHAITPDGKPVAPKVFDIPHIIE
jgi:hypothetical protein